VAWRDKRDRILQRLGWTVFHFSGSEFYHKKEGCVLEVYDFALRRLRSRRDMAVLIGVGTMRQAGVAK